MIVVAEEFLHGKASCPTQPIPATQAGPTTTELFRPQVMLKPEYLDKMATHLQVMKFIQSAEIYITTGFTTGPPAKGTWNYLVPLMHMTWTFALEKSGAKDKDLMAILKMLEVESKIRNPVHDRRVLFLDSKRGATSHSDFLDQLEESMSLIEFEKLTEAALITHIFLRESDSVMTKVASDNLHETEGAGNISKLRNEIKMVEASRWYNGKRHDGKKVGDGDKKWCENCNSTTHDTVQC